MDLIQISKLDQLNEVVNNDFFPLVDSGSLTTFRATFDLFAVWAEKYATASYVVQAGHASYALTASYVPSCSLALTTSYLYYTASFPVNGTASYTLYAMRVETASYVDEAGSTAMFATNVLSASWASSSISASYISASGIKGVLLSASYALTASYAITASYVLSASYAEHSSNADTASYVRFAESSIQAEPFNIYGPFISDTNSTSPTTAWGQYDEYKRSVAFILEGQSDVVVKCIVNYDNYGVPQGGTRQYRYFGVRLLGEGLPDPIASATINSKLNSVDMASVRDVVGDVGHTGGISELIFNISALDAGQYRVYVMPLRTPRHIGSMEYAISASNDQIVDYNLFQADAIVPSTELRILKFSNSTKVLVYAKKNVLQGIYPTPSIPLPVATWKFWELYYRVTDNTLARGEFKYKYEYTSTLGNSTADWNGPIGIPGQVIKIQACLPTDHVLTSVTDGPTGTITSGPTVTSIACSLQDSNDMADPCGGWYYDKWGPHTFYCP